MQVQDHGGVQVDVVHPVQLEAGELDGEHVVLDVVEDGLHDGAADVADGGDLPAVGAEDRLDHLRGGGLAVGAGDAEPRDGAVGLLHAPGELGLPPDGDARGARLLQQGRGGSPARRGDDQVGAGRKLGRDPPAEPDGDVEVLQQRGLVGMRLGLVEHDDACSERHQPVGSREAGDAEPGDDDLGLGPGRRPVGGVDPVESHCPTTHSA